MYHKLKHKFQMNICIIVTISSFFLAMLLDPSM